MNAGPTTVDAEEFAGFPADAMRFLDELADNQNKEWMAANKARYEHSVREPLASLVVALSNRFATAAIPLQGDSKRSLFRLNRDVRFSADKRPYNDHASAALTRDGERQSPGVLYIQLAPSGSFAAAGFFRPDPGSLHRLREALVASPEGWSKMVRGLAKSGLALDRGDTLVRPSKGFEDAPDAVADDLKLKSWTITRPISPDELASSLMLDVLEQFGRDAMPLLQFGFSLSLP